MELEWQTRLSVQECVRRLEESANMRGRNLFAGLKILGSMLTGDAKPVLGRIRDSGEFQLEKLTYYQNSFRPVFYGELIEVPGGGTRIVGRFGMDTFVKVFMGIWFGMLVLIGGPIALASLGQILRGHQGGSSHEASYLAVLAPVCMALFGLAMVAFGRWLGRGEKAYLIDFIREKLEAVPASASVQDARWT